MQLTAALSPTTFSDFVGNFAVRPMADGTTRVLRFSVLNRLHEVSDLAWIAPLFRYVQHLINLDDDAVVVRKQDGKVKIKQAVDLVLTDAVGGAFWGMLIGLLFGYHGWAWPSAP